MNKLVIPPSPTWYSMSVLTCANDDTLIYGGYSNFVVIKPTPDDAPHNIRIFSTYNRIICVKCNPNWGNPDKQAAIFSQDGLVTIWDIDNEVMKMKQKMTSNMLNDKLVGGNYCGTGKIVSVFERGQIVIWKYGAGEVSVLKDLFGSKVYINTFSINPHATWMGAFGLRNGLIMIVDFRKNGRVLHQLRCHDYSVTSLSWCPTPYNIFDPPIPPQEEIVEPSLKPTPEEVSDEIARENVTLDDGSNKKDVEKLNEPSLSVLKGAEAPKNIKEEVESKLDIILDGLANTPKPPSYTRKNKTNPWVNLVHADDDEQISSDDEPTPITLVSPADFAEECRLLEERIKLNKHKRSTTAEEKQNNETTPVKEERRLLKAKRCTKSLNEITQDVENLKIDPREIGDVIIDSVVPKELRAKKLDAQQETYGQHNTTPLVKKVEQKREHLLASIGSDGMICVWRVFEGKLEKKLFSAKKSSNRRKTTRPDLFFESLCWITPNIILSSLNVQLVQWNLLEDKFPKYKLVHSDHSECIFCITANVRLFQDWEPASWPAEDSLTVWSYSRDRYILHTRLGSSKENLCCYPTFGGSPNCIAMSPMHPSRIAIGIHQGRTYTWELSKPHLKNINMTMVPCKVLDNLTVLAWHPQQEMILAYGTSRGRIGILTCTSSPSMLKEFFMTEIHKIEWGPDCTNNWVLYAVAEGKFVYFNTEKLGEDPLQIPFNKNEMISNFAWKPDYTMLVVGTKTGSVSILSKSFLHLATIYVQSKLISNMKWHPAATAEDEDVSPQHVFFAATSSTDICLYSVSDLKCNEMDQPIEKVKSSLIKDAHSKIIRDIDWSTYENGKLVTAGEDGVAKVWNMKSQEVIATFVTDELSPLTTVLWSPLEKNHIIIGTKMESLHIFNVKDCPLLSEETLERLRKKRAEILQLNKNYIALRESPITKSQPVDIIKKRPESAVGLLSGIDSLPYISHLHNCIPEKVSWSMLKEKRNDDLNESSCSSDVAKEEALVKFFQGREEVLESLNVEYKKHQKNGKHTSAHLLSLYKGDIGDSIKEAIQHNRVTPWLLTIAPMVSPKLWMEACETYAKQLLDSDASNPREAASYFLACHKVEEAINALISGKLFNEAYAIAKCRLSADDHLLKRILEEWAKYLIYCGQYEQAVPCYILLERYEDAAKYLSKRSNESALKLALELAQRCDNSELLASIQMRYNEIKESKEEVVADPLPTRGELFLEQKTEETCCDESSNKTEMKLDVSGSNSTVGEEVPRDLSKEFEEDFAKKLQELKMSNSSVHLCNGGNHNDDIKKDDTNNAEALKTID